MKLKKSKNYDPRLVKTMLAVINTINNLDSSTFETLDGTGLELTCLLDSNAALDLIYELFVGLPQDTVYNMFGTPVQKYHNNKIVPVAWYTTEYNEYAYSHSDYDQRGFIPDAINNVILDRRISATDKMKLLIESFNHLVKLSKKGK